MEKKNGRTQGKGFFVVVLVLSFITLALGIFFYLQGKSLNKLVLESENTVVASQEKFDELTSEISSLNNNIEEYKNLDQSIANKKEEFFGYASELEQKIINGESDLKIAYLTFDDGPYYLTYDFLDVLAKYDIQATFFELAKSKAFGKDVSGVYQAVKQAGHTIGNHTYSHQLGKGGIYSSPDRFMEDIVKNREFIYDKLGIITDVMRFPGGSPTAGIYKAELVERIHALGYGYVDWDVSCGDGTVVLTAEEYAYNILSTTNDQDIIVVLMHDYQENTFKALPSIIEGLQEQGYMFLPLWRNSVKVN